MPLRELKDRLQKLTGQEIQELQTTDAMRVMENNCNLLVDIEGVLFDEIGECGKHQIARDQLKSLKQTVLEQNRALKVVAQNE